MTATVAVAASGPSHRDDSLFLSIFPHTHFTIPTPEATPTIGALSSPTQSTVGFNTAIQPPNAAVAFSRAWSAVTRHLTLPPGIECISPAPADQNIQSAFSIILASDSGRQDLLSWIVNETNAHFRTFTRPLLSAWDAPILLSDEIPTLRATMDVLKKAQRNRYLGAVHGLVLAARHGQLEQASNLLYSQIRSALHTTILHSLPRHRLQKTLASVMFQHMAESLDGTNTSETCIKRNECVCKLNLDALPLHALYEVGLGGLGGERAFAHALHKFMQGPAIQRRCFQVDWNGHSSVVPKLRTWVERHLSPTIQQALAAITGNAALRLTPNDVQQFISMAVSNLGRLRTQAAFDYVKSWPASTGAILDIREYLLAGGPTDKARLCQSFSDQIQTRLLHAGASTSEILSVYVNVIHVFRNLDSRGVLLDKVALPIRNYLRSREDSVSIIAASFLADEDHENTAGTIQTQIHCPDITTAVVNSTLAESHEKKSLHWDDMEWLPDPIDAGPDYKSSQTDDVVAYILGLFEQEEFIKEVTSVLAQHLLHQTDPEYVKDTRLVELFKSRLDASKLQAAEVMLKDMRDSVSLGKRINPHAHYNAAALPPPTPREIQAAIPTEGITLSSLYQPFEARVKRPQFMAAVKLVATKRNDLFFAKRTRIPQDRASSNSDGKVSDDLTFRAHILSSFFWPQLRTDDFDIPSAPALSQANFEEKFNALGSQRKLHFRPGLARASLRLDLEDRTVEEHDLPGWRASVIDVFSSERLQDRGLRPEQISEMLRMDEDLVQDALNFWSGKDVLYQIEAGLYAVLERLDMDRGTASIAHPQVQESISAVVSQDAMLRESAPMFSTFIANMLRNQGPKQIGGMMGITSLLKMVLPTFTYGDEEVAWLLGDMEAKGEALRNGDMWSVA